MRSYSGGSGCLIELTIEMPSPMTPHTRSLLDESRLNNHRAPRDGIDSRDYVERNRSRYPFDCLTQAVLMNGMDGPTRLGTYLAFLGNAT